MRSKFNAAFANYNKDKTYEKLPTDTTSTTPGEPQHNRASRTTSTTSAASTTSTFVETNLDADDSSGNTCYQSGKQMRQKRTITREATAGSQKPEARENYKMDIEKNAGAIAADPDERAKMSSQPEDASKPKPLWCTCKGFCGFIIVLIALLLIGLAVLYLMSNSSTKTTPESPSSSLPLFPDPSYYLFGTKTLYSTAYKILMEKSASCQAKKDEIKRPLIDFDTSDVAAPTFEDDYTLECLHKKLLSEPYSCQPHDLYFIGRHGARFPDRDEIEDLNRRMLDIKRYIDLRAFAPKPTINVGQDVTVSRTPDAGEPVAMPNLSHPIRDYLDWTSFMSPEQDNLVLRSGIEESAAIASRFAALFPKSFDRSQSEIEFGVTKKIRTAQTAIPFASKIENVAELIGGCRPQDFPNTDNPMVQPGDITSNKCYKTFIKSQTKPILDPKQHCKDLNMYTRPEPNHSYNFTHSAHLSPIADSISNLLKLDAGTIKPEDVKTLYKICKYESAYKMKPSIWCNLFNKDELKFLEYIGDIDDYLNQGLASKGQNRKIVCKLANHLVKEITDFADQGRKAHTKLFFTHSAVVQRFLTYMLNFAGEPAYKLANVKASLEGHRAPGNRRFQSSLLTPFSANLAFVSYECKPTKGDSLVNSNRVLVASINERPVKLVGCDSVACDAQQALRKSDLDEIKEHYCKEEEYCSEPLVDYD